MLAPYFPAAFKLRPIRMTTTTLNLVKHGSSVHATPLHHHHAQDTKSRRHGPKMTVPFAAQLAWISLICSHVSITAGVVV